MQLKPGDTIYRAMINVEDRIEIRTSTVKAVGKRITIGKDWARLGLHGRVYRLDALGRIFFTTREAALERLALDLQRGIESAKREIKFNTKMLGAVRVALKAHNDESL